jgi:hypothetical protein
VRRPSLLLPGLAAAAIACVHQVSPTVTPARVPAVSPPIQARALLLIAPSFGKYVSASSSGPQQFRYHFGESATPVLNDLVRRSFTKGETRYLSDAEVLQWLTAPTDTTVADLLLVPTFEAAGAHDRILDVQAEVRLRLNVRSLHAGTTQSWVTLGGTTRVVSSRGGLTGSALEEALRALSDTLAAHRVELEAKAPTK